MLTYGRGEGSSKVAICKRDYEYEIKQLNIRIEVFENLFLSIKDFFNRGYQSWIDDRDVKNSLLIMYAGLEIDLTNLKLDLDNLLDEQEMMNKS